MSAPSDLLLDSRARRHGALPEAVALAGGGERDIVLGTSALIAVAVATQAAPLAPATAPVPGLDRSRLNPTKRTLRFTVPVTDGPSYLGDINLAVATDDSLSVDAARLLQMIEPILKPDVFGRLKAVTGEKAEVSETLLAAERIGLAYDGEKLALSILIPVAARRQSLVSLRTAISMGEESVAPAGLSAFLNFRSALDFVERGGDRGLGAPVSLIDGAVRAFGMVAETEGYLSLRKDEPFMRRSGSRLVYDDRKNLVRWSFGDAAPFTRGFQGSLTVAGFSAARFYNVLEPSREYRASGSRSFSLLARSLVETLVNGRSVERKLLQPGNYTLEDFPLAEGANDVRLLIRDEGGQQRTIEFGLYSNRQLLESGTTEFSTFAGVYSTPTASGIHYSRDWAASGFVRKGLSQQLTGGLTFQADGAAQQAGTELLLGSRLGLVGLDLAASRRSTGGAGFAGVATYEKIVQSGGVSHSLSLRALLEARSARFATPGLLVRREPLAVRASAGLALTLGRDTFIALDGQLAHNRDDGRSRYSVRGTGGFRLTDGLSAIAELEWEKGRERNGAVARIGLRKRLGSRGTAQLDFDSRGALRTSYQNSKGSGIGAWSGSVDLNRDAGQTSVNANGSYLANRLELSVTQFGSYGASDRRLSNMRTSMRVGTSIALADGAIAVGRPIQQAFLIAEPHSSLDGKRVRIDPQQKSEQARSGLLGGAVDGTFSAYSPRTIIYDVPDAPPGYDLGAGNVQLMPPYKAGYRFEVGSDYHLLVIGRLLDRAGQPVALLAGKAIDLKAPKRAAVTMFTSRGGKFGVQGLRPGAWRIEMPTEGRPTIYEIIVKDDPSGTVRVGDIRPAG